LSSAEVRYLKISFDEVLSSLREYAKRKSGQARAIVLVGSLARGDYAGTSDADVLVIADDVPARFLDRTVLFADAKTPVDLEPRVYTTDEFVRKVRDGDPFAMESLDIGIPLHGDRFFNELRESLGKQCCK